MTVVSAELSQLLDSQCGVVTREQLSASGVTASFVRAQLEARRWRSLNELVICSHNGPLTPEQARWAVYSSAAGPRALCGLTAMSMWGVRGSEPSEVHVLVRRGARVLVVPGVAVKVHESRRFTAEDVCPGRRPPVTSLSRCTIDAGVWSKTLGDAMRVVVAPVQQRRVLPASLSEELEKAGAVRYRRPLRCFLADLGGGAEALSEVEFLRWCRRHGFPRPTLQARLDAAGRRRYLDAEFTAPGGRRVFVEIDGGIHLTLATRWMDTAKDNDMALSNQLSLRFPSVAIYGDDPRAVRQLRQALGLVSATQRYGAL